MPLLNKKKLILRLLNKNLRKIKTVLAEDN